MINPTQPTKVDPKLSDVAFDEINAVLKANLTWLDNTYSNIERLRTNKLIFPKVYVGTKKNRGYLSLFPDSHLGNYCYIELMEHETIPEAGSSRNDVDFKIVFFFNYEKIYTDHKLRTIENVKRDVLTILERYPFQASQFRTGKIYEKAEDIFRGYSYKEINDTYMMRPYGALAIEGKIKFIEQCGGGVPNITIIDSEPTALTMYSLTEKKTGLKDYDGKDIYVWGSIYSSTVDVNGSDAVQAPFDKTYINRIVDSNISYDYTGFVDDTHDKTGTITYVGNLLYNKINSGTNTKAIYWFIYYTKA